MILNGNRTIPERLNTSINWLESTNVIFIDPLFPFCEHYKDAKIKMNTMNTMENTRRVT
jgi:hypothetical protein